MYGIICGLDFKRCPETLKHIAKPKLAIRVGL
jgi:hypothetical protein